MKLSNFSKTELLVLAVIFLTAFLLYVTRLPFVFKGNDLTIGTMLGVEGAQKPFLFASSFRESGLYHLLSYSHGLIKNSVIITLFKIASFLNIRSIEYFMGISVSIVNLILSVFIYLAIRKLYRKPTAFLGLILFLFTPIYFSQNRDFFSLRLFNVVLVLGTFLVARQALVRKKLLWIGLSFFMFGILVLDNRFALLYILILLAILWAPIKIFLADVKKKRGKLWLSPAVLSGLLFFLFSAGGVFYFNICYAGQLSQQSHLYQGLIFRTLGRISKGVAVTRGGFTLTLLLRRLYYLMGPVFLCLAPVALFYWIFFDKQKLRSDKYFFTVFLAFFLPILFLFDINALGTYNKFIYFLTPLIILTSSILSHVPIERVCKFFFITSLCAIIALSGIIYSSAGVLGFQPLSFLYKNTPDLPFYSKYEGNLGFKTLGYYLQKEQETDIYFYDPSCIKPGEALFYTGSLPYFLGEDSSLDRVSVQKSPMVVVCNSQARMSIEEKLNLQSEYGFKKVASISEGSKELFSLFKKRFADNREVKNLSVYIFDKKFDREFGWRVFAPLDSDFFSYRLEL